MKRRVVPRVIVFLLVGAIVNVAVAWFGFLITNGQGFQRWVLFERWIQTPPSAYRLWTRHSSDGWPEASERLRSWHGWFASGWHMGLAVGGSYHIRNDATDAELLELYRGSGSFCVEQIDIGVPFGSMRLERWVGNPHSRWFMSTEGHDGLVINDQVLPRRVLPFCFAINTVVYAAILWPLFAAPFALRRRRRLKRGLCPACAYPVGASEACTECGNTVRLKRV